MWVRVFNYSPYYLDNNQEKTDFEMVEHLEHEQE